MNYLRVCVLLFVLASIGLHAGSTNIEKGGAIQKEMNLSVTHKDSQQDQNKVTITVTFKGDKTTKVRLISDGSAKEISTEVKDDMVTTTFEIEKSLLEKSTLNIIPSNRAKGGGSLFGGPQKRCLDSGYFMYLKEFVV